MVKRSLDLASAGGAAAVPEALRRVSESYARTQGARIDDRDGVRVDVSEGWVHLRASNTEPIIRVIAEARTADGALALARACASSAGLSIG